MRYRGVLIDICVVAFRHGVYLHIECLYSALPRLVCWIFFSIMVLIDSSKGDDEHNDYDDDDDDASVYLEIWGQMFIPPGLRKDQLTIYPLLIHT